MVPIGCITVVAAMQPSSSVMMTTALFGHPILGPECNSTITGAVAVMILFSTVNIVAKGPPAASVPSPDGPEMAVTSTKKQVDEADCGVPEALAEAHDAFQGDLLLSTHAANRFGSNDALVLGDSLPGGTGDARLVRVGSGNDANSEAVGVFKARSGENVFAETIPKGTGYMREQAASLLDSDGFVGVPVTVHADLVRQGSIVDSGSLARFVPNATPSWDFGSSRFTESDVHRIAMFDIRTLNLDRNGGNMLLQCNSSNSTLSSGGGTLVPIDHGQILPERLDYVDLDWVFWPQTEKPFTPEEMDYIRSLDVERDVRLLQERLKPATPGDALSDDALMSLAIGTAWLQACATCGLNLRQIGEAMLRPSLTSKSHLECMVETARAKVGDRVQAPSEQRAAIMAALTIEARKWVSEKCNAHVG